jgi:subtilisin-like proprotein convertase family protein
MALLGVLALALSVTVGLSAGVAEAKKKKAKVGGTVDITQTVNGAIPDATATTFGTLQSNIAVAGKKFKGSKIRDVNVTVQTQATGGATPADNLRFRLTAPDGTTTWLVGSGFLAGTSVGPLTFDDETPVNIGGLPPAPDSTTLVAPYAGTAQPHCFSAFGGCELGNMDNGSASGTWTLRVQDTSAGGGETSSLVSWRLVMVAGKKFKT